MGWLYLGQDRLNEDMGWLNLGQDWGMWISAASI
jgi:hypothetical protein